MRLTKQLVTAPSPGAAFAAGLGSGIVASLAFPPVDAGWVAFLALVPLALVVRTGRPTAVAAGSAGFSLAFFGLLITWMQQFGWPAYIGLVVLESVLVVPTMLVALPLRSLLPGVWWGAVFPVAFLAAEYLRSEVPYGGFPWGGLGYSQHESQHLLRLAPLAGVWGVSLVVGVANALAAEFVARVVAASGAGRRRWVPAVSLLVVAAAVLAVPAALPSRAAGGNPARVAIVQGNAPEEPPGFRTEADDVIVLRNHLAVTASIGPPRPDLVMWPEGSVESPLSDDRIGGPLREAIRSVGAPFIVGATIGLPDGRFENTSLFFRADGSPAGKYVKMHLVPFGEYVPLRRLLSPLVKEIALVPSDGVPGRTHRVFSISQGSFASVICYENTDADLVRGFVRRGARLLVVSTNNASFGRTAMPRQHLAFSQLRAAEHGIWVVHGALTGISAAIDPSGRVIARSGMFRPALLTPTVRFATSATPYARMGDWLPLAAVVLVAGGALAAALLPPLARRAPAPRAVGV
ncbi:MAG: apolipoprotein N-acyltransferase [Actinomycetota bacterium]